MSVIIGEVRKLIQNMYAEYINDPYCVYTCVGNYIVVMKKCDETKTNELRDRVVDPKFARFRANRLLVLVIFNKFVPNVRINYVNAQYGWPHYEVNKIISDNRYDPNINYARGSGIQYTRTIEPAFHCVGDGHVAVGSKMFEHVTGTWMKWFDNGTKSDEFEIVNGKRHGKFMVWFENGNVKMEGTYMDNKLNGLFICRHDNGSIQYEATYIEDKLHGKSTHWGQDGILTHFNYYFYGVHYKTELCSGKETTRRCNDCVIL